MVKMAKAEKNKNLIRLPTPSVQTDGGQVSRPPVVVVLGHVDHGKTTLLDWIRKTKVAEKEAGGITQHIGAYQVSHQNKKITFIDTPGHEAFSAMRSRGAKVADLAVLVIAAEEGVKPQTKEAISYIKKAGIPQIVAINKIDLPKTDPAKVKLALEKEDVQVESLGGKIPSIEISAKTGKNVSELLELILLVAEMEDLKADLKSPAEGVIIESYLDSQRGATCTLLVKNGTLKSGEIIGTPSIFGKIKILEDFQGNPIREAFPSMPCILLGFQGVPGVGEKFKVFDSLELAQKYTQTKQKKADERVVIETGPEKKILNLILKTDVLGSLEAVEQVLKNLPQERVSLRILKKEVGEITESDVKLAQSGKAKILGFRVKTNPVARKLADRENITILNFDIIYDLSQKVRILMEKFLEPEIERVNLGKVKVSVIFRTEKNRQIIGGKVIEGEVRLGTKIEVIRILAGKEEAAGKGKLINLQKDKRDMGRVAKGENCGVLYEGDVKIEEGDTLIIYTEERRKGEL